MTFIRTRLVRRFSQRAAAPEGGTQQWVRGCVFVLAAIPTILPAQSVPSGQTVELVEVLIDKVGNEDWLRFRFLAPEIARELGGLTYADVAPDMTVLCDQVALPYMKEEGLAADKLAIGLSDRPVDFGTPDPDATQFIEVYSVVDMRCEWEAF